MYYANIRVDFGHVDPARVVYYPRLVNYFHLSMESFFREVLEVPYPEFTGEHKLGLPAVKLEVDFKSTIAYGDELKIGVHLERIGQTSVTWRYEIFWDVNFPPSCVGRVVTVCIDMDSFEKTPLPGWLKEALVDYQTEVGKSPEEDSEEATA